MEALIALIGALGLIVFALFYGSFTWGFVLYKFYYWFLLPVYTNLVHINYWEAIGLVCFVMVIKSHNHTSIKEEYRDKNYEVAAGLIAPWLILGIGWVIHLII